MLATKLKLPLEPCRQPVSEVELGLFDVEVVVVLWLVVVLLWGEVDSGEALVWANIQAVAKTTIAERRAIFRIHASPVKFVRFDESGDSSFEPRNTARFAHNRAGTCELARFRVRQAANSSLTLPSFL